MAIILLRRWIGGRRNLKEKERKTVFVGCCREHLLPVGFFPLCFHFIFPFFFNSKLLSPCCLPLILFSIAPFCLAANFEAILLPLPPPYLLLYFSRRPRQLSRFSRNPDPRGANNFIPFLLELNRRRYGCITRELHARNKMQLFFSDGTSFEGNK